MRDLSVNLQHLRHFLAIADTGSLRKAAESLSLSQSAITKSLKTLEAQLGVPLVDRGTQGSLITEYGKVVVAHARLVGVELDALSTRLHEMKGDTGSSLRIGTAAAASLELLPGVISFFMARFPACDIDVQGGLPSRLLPRLLEGTLDLVIGPKPGVDMRANIQSTPLFFSDNVIIVRKGHPLERARSLREFGEAKWVLTNEMAAFDSTLGIARARLSMAKLITVLRTDEPFLALRLVADTDCVSVTRKSFFSTYLSTKHIVPVELSDLDLSEQIAVFTRKSGHIPILAARFIEILNTHAARIPG